MKTKKYKVLERFLTAGFILLSGILIFFFTYYSLADISTPDSSAIFGGELEDGYLSSAYLLAYKEISTNTAEITTCGLVFVDEATAVTAAHCIAEESKSYAVGIGEFDVEDLNLLNPASIISHPLWDGEQRKYDIAVLNFAEDDISEIANIAAPQKSCNYTIVGYGLNENDTESETPTRLRKSLDVCIELVTEELIYISTDEGNVCFGDSGSPIFEKGTNNVVGILSSIFTSSDDYLDFCTQAGNSLAVRLDYHKELITPSLKEEVDSELNEDNSEIMSNTCNRSCLETETCINNECVARQSYEDIVYEAKDPEIVQSDSFIYNNRKNLIQGTLILIAIDVLAILIIRVRNFF